MCGRGECHRGNASALADQKGLLHPKGFLSGNPHVLKNDVLISRNRLIQQVLPQILGISPGKSPSHQPAEAPIADMCQPNPSISPDAEDFPAVSESHPLGRLFGRSALY